MATKISLLWRLRLALHGVRLSPFAHRDLTTGRGERHVAYRATMLERDLFGAETAPLEVRVNMRAASFVLRRFGLRVADLRADADGALLSIAPHRVGFAARPKAKSAGRSAA